MDDIDRQITRLAEILGSDFGGAEQEAVGIAVGLAGVLVKSAVRLADALEKIADGK